MKCWMHSKYPSPKTPIDVYLCRMGLTNNRATHSVTILTSLCMRILCGSLINLIFALGCTWISAETGLLVNKNAVFVGFIRDKYTIPITKTHGPTQIEHQSIPRCLFDIDQMAFAIWEFLRRVKAFMYNWSIDADATRRRIPSKS